MCVSSLDAEDISALYLDEGFTNRDKIKIQWKVTRRLVRLKLNYSFASLGY